MRVPARPRYFLVGHWRITTLASCTPILTHHSLPPAPHSLLHQLPSGSLQLWSQLAFNGQLWNRVFYALSPKCGCSQVGNLISASLTGFTSNVTGCTTGTCSVREKGRERGEGLSSTVLLHACGWVYLDVRLTTEGGPSCTH